MSVCQVRIDLTHGVERNMAIRRLSELFGGDGYGAYLVVHEIGRLGKAHLQGWVFVENHRKYMDAIRVVFPELGRGCKSCSEVKEFEGWKRYICKGVSASQGPDVVMRHGVEYSDDFVALQHEAYWAQHAKQSRAPKEDASTFCEYKKGTSWVEKMIVETLEFVEQEIPRPECLSELELRQALTLFVMNKTAFLRRAIRCTTVREIVNSVCVCLRGAEKNVLLLEHVLNGF